MEAQKNKNNLKTAVIYCGMMVIFGALIYLALGTRVAGEFCYRYYYFYDHPDDK